MANAIEGAAVTLGASALIITGHWVWAVGGLATVLINDWAFSWDWVRQGVPKD